jgi:hypothetical protein
MMEMKTVNQYHQAFTDEDVNNVLHGSSTPAVETRSQRRSQKRSKEAAAGAAGAASKT